MKNINGICIGNTWTSSTAGELRWCEAVGRCRGTTLSIGNKWDNVAELMIRGNPGLALTGNERPASLYFPGAIEYSAVGRGAELLMSPHFDVT